jgi:hypothetical protein
MTPDQNPRLQAKLKDIQARLAEWDAEEPKRIRLKVESEVALERLHRANVALRAALPR